MHKDEATELGLTSYVPDKPCRRGHWHRRTSTGACIPCQKMTSKKWMKENREHLRVKQQEYRDKNGDDYKKYIREYMRKYYTTEKYKIYIREYRDRKREENKQGNNQDNKG